MSVLKACGISELKLLRFVMIIASCLALLVGWLSMCRQWASKSGNYFCRSRTKSELDRLTPKNFYPLRGGKELYVDSVGENGELQDVFLSVSTGMAGSADNSLVVVVAGEGNQHLTEDGSERF